jgi:hypothetical protein
VSGSHPHKRPACSIVRLQPWHLDIFGDDPPDQLTVHIVFIALAPHTASRE